MYRFVLINCSVIRCMKEREWRSSVLAMRDRLCALARTLLARFNLEGHDIRMSAFIVCKLLLLDTLMFLVHGSSIRVYRINVPSKYDIGRMLIQDECYQDFPQSKLFMANERHMPTLSPAEHNRL